MSWLDESVVIPFVRPEPSVRPPNPITVTVDTDPQDPAKPFIDCWATGEPGSYVYLVYTHDERQIPRVFRTVQHWRAALMERSWALKAKASVRWGASTRGRDWELGDVEILDNKGR